MIKNKNRIELWGATSEKRFLNLEKNFVTFYKKKIFDKINLRLNNANC